MHPTSDSVRAPATRPAGDSWRSVALAGLTLALVALCAVLAVPFLPAITWGVALAIIAWPLHLRMRRWIGQPGLAAAVSTALVLAAILLPIIAVSYQLTREAAAATRRLDGQSPGEVLREKTREFPGLAQVIEWTERNDIDIEKAVRDLFRSYASGVSDLAQGSLSAMIQFLVASFILYHLFRDRDRFLTAIRGLMPLSREQGERVLARASDSVHANLYATVVTSLIDAVSFGVLFSLLGLPAPVLWGVVIFVLAILPVVGSALVWVPAAVYLAMTDRWPSAAALVGWGLFTAVFIDNLLMVRLVGGRLRIHPVAAMIGFLGGIAVFGISGIVIGPALLAVTEAVLDVWKGHPPDPAAP